MAKEKFDLQLIIQLFAKWDETKETMKKGKEARLPHLPQAHVVVLLSYQPHFVPDFLFRLVIALL